MQKNVRTMLRSCVLTGLVLGIAAAVQAATDVTTFDFRAGDLFLGSTGGNVIVFRPSNSTKNQVLQTLSDGVTNPGPVTSLFIDNTWHPLAADPGSSFNQSKIVRFSILPQVSGTGTQLPQTPLSTFDASFCNGLSSANIQSIAIDGKGNIFAANTTPPTIAELSPSGGCTTTASSVAVSAIASIDLNTAENFAYFTSGDNSIRRVALPLTSSIATVSTFLSFSGSVSLFDIRVVPPGAITNCGGGTADCLLVVAQGNTNFCTGTLTGVSAKSCVLLIDTSTKAVVTTYTISGQNSLQSLTLDPIVRDCTATDCTNLNPQPTAKLNFFWVAPLSSQFFKVDVASGTASGFNAGMGVVIHSLFVYSGFGANESIPTEFSGSLSSLTSTSNSAVFNFPLPVSSDTNTLTISQVPAPSSTTQLTVFAAAIDPAGGANDAGQPCTQTAGTSCVYWEVESTPDNVTLTFHLSAPGLDNNARGFRDGATDTTISLDLLSRGGNSLYTYHQITGPFEGCHYIPTTQFFDGATINANRNSITFRFQCDGLPGTQLQTLAPPPPRISIVQFVPGQNPVPFFPDLATLVGGTCCTVADYRYDTSSNTWVINISFKGVTALTQFNATTFIDSQKAQAFDINFTFGGSK